MFLVLLDQDRGNGYEYELKTVAKVWNQARSACVLDGGDLASIHTREDMKYIYNLDPNPFSPRWVGAKFLSGSWVWSDGTPFDVFTTLSNNYDSSTSCVRTTDPDTNNCLWSIEEPDFSTTTACIRVGFTKNSFGPAEWNDGSCGVAHPFVCQRPICKIRIIHSFA
jgi:hypothetical protein